MLDYITIEPEKTAQYCIIWLHGLGADANDFVPIIPDLKLNLPIRYIFPNAPVRSVTLAQGQKMRCWFDIVAIAQDARYNLEQLFEIENQIQALLDKQIFDGIPSEKIILAGFSQGGALALFTGLRYFKKLAGIMGLSTFIPDQKDLINTLNPANAQTPILMAHGTSDFIVPYQYGNQSLAWLRDRNYPISWKEYNMAHSVCPQEIADIAEWITHRFV